MSSINIGMNKTVTIQPTAYSKKHGLIVLSENPDTDTIAVLIERDSPYNWNWLPIIETYKTIIGPDGGDYINIDGEYIALDDFTVYD